MSGIIIDGDMVNYVAHGRGRPILFVHGRFGSWRYWWPVMDALATEPGAMRWICGASAVLVGLEKCILLALTPY
jgi:pimeloyl-ACP methyl ester carboxylesterase